MRSEHSVEPQGLLTIALLECQQVLSRPACDYRGGAGEELGASGAR